MLGTKVKERKGKGMSHLAARPQSKQGTSASRTREGINRTGWARVKRAAAIKTGWNQGLVDRRAAKGIEEGRIGINKRPSGKQRRLKGRVGRREARIAGMKGPRAERERVRQRVKKWVEGRARKGVITAAMLKDMEKHLRRRPGGEGGARESTQAVLAAPLTLVEEKGWVI